MSFKKIFYGGEGTVYIDSGLPFPGVIYTITSDGRLLWYEDMNRLGQNGSSGQRYWARNSGSQIGKGWGDFKHVFSDGDGIIYTVTQDGKLLWYKDENRQGQNGPNGETGWATGSGSQIGIGWGNFKHVFASGSGRGGGGVIYAVTSDGRLLWYRDENRQGQNGPNGESGWAVGSGSQIGVGWSDFKHVFGHGGTIYAITSDGRLLWYQNENSNGSNGANGESGWTAGSGNQIDSGWGNFKHVFTGGFGSSGGSNRGIIIYAVTENDDRLVTGQILRAGDLYWFKDDDLNGTNGSNGQSGWAIGSGNKIGKGW